MNKLQIKKNNKRIAIFMNAKFDSTLINFSHGHESTEDFIKKIENSPENCYCNDDMEEGYTYQDEWGDCDNCLEHYQNFFLNGGKKHGHIYTNYHESWDWLMPVVKKIASMDQSKVNIHIGTGCTDSFSWCNINWDDGKNIFKTSQLLNIDEQEPLKAVYKAVVEFINWYDKITNQHSLGLVY